MMLLLMTTPLLLCCCYAKPHTTTTKNCRDARSTKLSLQHPFVPCSIDQSKSSPATSLGSNMHHFPSLLRLKRWVETLLITRNAKYNIRSGGWRLLPPYNIRFVIARDYHSHCLMSVSFFTRVFIIISTGRKCTK